MYYKKSYYLILPINFDLDIHYKYRRKNTSLQAFYSLLVLIIKYD